MVWVLLGPPGSGKGTQAHRCAPKMDMTHVSTGDLLREEIKNESPAGVEAAGYVAAGKLIPDGTMLNILEKRMRQLSPSKVILDGYPRNKEQALALQKMLRQNSTAISKVVNIEVDTDELVERLTKRVTCSKCGSIYNLRDLENPAVCSKPDCGGMLKRRNDDNARSIATRLEEYRELTAPLIEYYNTEGLLTSIDGGRPPEEVSASILSLRENGNV